MNKPLFWTGISLQAIHLFVFMILGLTLITWNWAVVLGITYIMFNIVSLTMIFVGAIGNQKKKDDEQYRY